MASASEAAVVLASRERAARRTQVRFRLLTFLLVVVGASAASGGSYSDSSLGRYEGPSFSQEPPHLVEFSNSTGSQVMCKARGNPEPKVTWLLADGSPLSSLSGVRHVTSDGTLVFPPFRAEEYRQDVHAVVYLCAASNNAGTVVSRDVKVKAVVVQPYEVYVYDVYTIRGNSAVMKCHVPNFLQDYVTVTSWVRDGAFAIPTANVEENGKYVVLAGGHLVVNHVGAEDAGNSFRCQTQHRLTGETRISLTAGKLYVTDPQGSVPPRISASEITVTGKEGDTAVIPCVTQGYPAPTTTWYTQVSQGHLLPLQPLARGSRFSVKSSALVARELRPEDSGVYVCEASNNMGTERVYTRLTVTTALRVEVKPSAVTADIGRTVSFQCVTSGLPAPTITWLKDGTPLPAENVNFQEVHTLTIRSVTAAQRGMYQCVAKNDVASAQGIAELKLGDTPPELISTFADQTLRPGSSIHLRCEASGTPPPQIIWTLDGKAVARQRTQDLVDGVVISWLNVTSVAIEDGGVYSCRATSKAGTSVHSARINIYGRLSARTRPPLKAIAERSAILHCPLIGYPWDSVTWEKDGFILPVNHRQNVLKNGTLLIERVRRSADGGKYYCTATNKQDDVSVRAEVEVTVMVPPKILPFAFQDDQFFKGMRAHIICAVSQGDLPLRFQWLKDGQVIRPNLGVVSRDIDGHANSLSIERVSSDHTGNYTCVVENLAARVTHTAQLLIYVSPKISPFSFQDDLLYEGSFARVSCVIFQGDLPITITWLKDGESISPKLGVTTRSIDEYSSILTIERIESKHNGNYTCLAKNAAAVTMYSAQLSVNVPPRWRVEPQDTSVAKGEGVTIPCDADGFPKPTTQWMKVQGNDPSGKKVAVLSTSFVHVLNNGSLRITHASEDHSGYYFCIATNGVGHDLGKVMHLAVLAPPSVLRKHSVAPAVKGETVQIACEVTGNFPIKVSWQVHGTTVSSGNNHRYHTVEEENMEKTLLRSELTISEVDKKDSTVYKCVAENSHGKDEGEVQLLVMEPPEAPQELRVAPAGNRTVEISWKTPFDGNSRISQYVVQYKRDSDKWKGQTQEVSVHGSDTNARIDRLYPATTYNFRIRAENDVGVGDASDVISFTTEEEAPDGPPETVEVEPTDASSLRVSWKPPDVNHRNGGIRGYNIGHKIHGLSDPYIFTNLEVPEDYTEDLIYQLTNLNMYTQYSIVVQAYNKGGRGPLSEEVVVLTSEDVPSEPPKEVRCSSLSSRSIYVIWEPPSTQSVNGILRGYKVLFKPINIISDILSQSKVAHVPKITLTELEVSTNYTIQVLAFTKMGDGIRSEPVFCKTHEDVPGSPDDIKVLPTSVDSVLVSWKPPGQRNGLVNKYNVYVRGIEDDGQEIQYSKDFAHNGDDNFDDIRTSEANNLFYEITGLRKNRRYEFWVTALSSIGEGPSSKVIIETPKGPTVAAKASSFDDVIKTPWKKDVVMPCRAVGTPPPHKKWLFGRDPVKESKRVQLRPDGSLQITGIQKEDSGNYTCKVINQHGKDDVTYCVIVQIPPGAPVLDVISKSLTSIQLQWRKGETGGDDVRGYVLHYKKDRGQWEKKELSGNLEAYHLDRLACGATYQLYMESFNTIGIGAPCDILTVATKDEEMTVPLKDDLIREGATFVTVQLDAWPSNGCPVLHFTAEYRKQASKEWILVGKNLKPTQKKVVIPSLTPATWYILRLTAYTSSGPSATEYNFSTHTAVGGTLSPDVVRKEEEKLVLFYIDPLIFVPIAAILAVIVVTIAVACFCCRSQHSSATKHPKNIKEWVRSSTPGASRGHRTPVHSYVHAHQKGERVTGSFSSLQGRVEDPVPYATSQLTTGISDQGFETGSSCSGTMNNEAFWKDKKGALELPVRPASDVFAQGGVAAQMWLAAHNNALVRRSMFPGAAPVSAGSRSGSTTSLIQQETGFSPGMQVRSRSGSLQGPGGSAKDSHAPERKSGPK